MATPCKIADEMATSCTTADDVCPKLRVFRRLVPAGSEEEVEPRWTAADGACSLHALWGRPKRGTYYCEDARPRLRRNMPSRFEDTKAVSYTHLTLPTIYSV